MEYLLLTSHDSEHLTGKVNLAIDNGWSPFGSVSVGMSSSVYEKSIVFAQALIRDIKPNSEPADARSVANPPNRFPNPDQQK